MRPVFSMPQFSLSAACLVLVACSAPTETAAQTPEPPRTLTVSGVGEVSGAPDIATITIGIETRGATPGDAISKNSEQMEKTITALRTFDIAPKDMQTASLTLTPQYDYGSNRSTPRITGYTAGNSLRVVLRDLDKAGDILDKSIGAGANRLNGMQFGFSNSQQMLNEARMDAVKKAKAKAALLADAADVELGALLKLQDNTAGAHTPAPVFRMEADAAAVSVPIERGELSLSASVSLVYEIR